MGLAGERLAAAGAALLAARQSGSRGAGASQPSPEAWYLQLYTACTIGKVCGMLAEASLDMQPSARLAHCLSIEQLLLGPGRIHVAEHAADSLPQYAHSTAASMLVTQLVAMDMLLTNADQQIASSSGRFGAQFAPPELYADWLEVAVGAAKTLHQSLQHGGGRGAAEGADTLLAPCLAHQLTSGLAVRYADERNALPGTMVALSLIVDRVLCSPRYGQLRAAIRQRCSVPHGIVGLLVPTLHKIAVLLRLPSDRRPAAYGALCHWRSIGAMANILSAAEMADALAAHMQPAPADSSRMLSTSGQRLLQTACLLVRHAPLEPASADAWLLTNLMQLLSCVCSAAGPSRGDRQQHQHQGAQLTEMAQQLLQAVPRLRQMLQLVAADEEQRFGGGKAVAVFRGWERAIALLRQLMPFSIIVPASASSSVIRTWSGLPAWCGAGTAAFQSLPLVAAIAQQQRDDADLQGVLLGLAGELFDFTDAFGAAPSHFGEPSLSSGALQLTDIVVGEAEVALWGLHTAACRCVHWQAAGDHPLAPMMQRWEPALQSASIALLEAWQLGQRLQPGTTEPARCAAACPCLLQPRCSELYLASLGLWLQAPGCHGCGPHADAAGCHLRCGTYR